MAETILIAGGSGLIGQHLCTKFIQLGYTVKLLGRKKYTHPQAEIFTWNPAQQEIEKSAFENVQYVINLAGSNVGEGRWTEKRKKELIDSRIQSTHLLINTMIENHYPVKKFIQASAIGYYGLSANDVEYKETDPPGNDFLATLTAQWEKETATLDQTSAELLLLRIGIVLSARGGALKAMAKPVQMLAGAPLGSGRQVIPWIHIDDMVAVFLKGITDPAFKGIYNAVSPASVTNRELTRLIGKNIHRPIWPVPVPSFILKIILGEQAQIVLGGNRVSCEKLIHTGFKHQYPQAADALKNLLSRP